MMIRHDDDDGPFDAFGILRDGRSVRVSLMMRDAAMADSMQRDAARRFGLGDALALHKPGQRLQVDEAARAHVEEVYQDEKRKLQDAWRKPVADAAGEFRGAQENDVCTVREGGVGEGGPGHLRMVNGRLVCVPDQRRQDSASVPRTMTADAAQKIRDEAWLASVQELENAWRGPAR
jgi:hypothetical protein